MSFDFRISPNSAQGLGQKSVENDLALVKQAGRWTLINLQKETIPSGSTVVRGQDLVLLMKTVAQAEKQLPQQFQGNEFKTLLKNTKFRNVCRSFSGIETADHRKNRKKAAEAFSRAVSHAKTIGKGLNKIERQGYEGRYVGKDQGEHSFWLKEVVLEKKYKREVEILFDTWKLDGNTKLSLKEWENVKRHEWQQANSGKEFLPYIAELLWEAEQKQAWQKENPTETFSQNKFQTWKETQHDPVLALPLWELKIISGTHSDSDFQKWRDEIIIKREEEGRKFNEDTGANIPFSDFERLAFEHAHSGTVENFHRWVFKHLHKISGSKEDFHTFVHHLKWEQDKKTGKTHLSLEDHIKQADSAISRRHIGSHLPLSLEEYRAQQDDGIFNDPIPFKLLNNDERKNFRTICEGGRLIRNNFPLDTRYEKTLNFKTGPGYAIFVIGPDQDLYSGSHIDGVFHHSSFLGEGAVLAAGEIKTNPDGYLVELSNKSGHYRPTNEENLFMLQYFLNRGVDLTNLKFTYYDAKGETTEHNALEYLNELEHQKSLNTIAPDLFT